MSISYFHLVVSSAVVQAFDEAFDFLRVLGLDVESHVEVVVSLFVDAFLLVDFAEQHGDGRFFGHEVLEGFEFMDGFIEPFEFDQGVGFLELV
jgi:hypothetical protein